MEANFTYQLRRTLVVPDHPVLEGGCVVGPPPPGQNPLTAHLLRRAGFFCVMGGARLIFPLQGGSGPPPIYINALQCLLQWDSGNAQHHVLQVHAMPLGSFFSLVIEGVWQVGML